MAIAGIIGTAISLVGTVISASAQQKMVAEQTRASKKAENAREQQMRLDATNRRRQAVRDAVMARAMGLTAGVSQGAQSGSGVAGGIANATGQGLENQQVSSASEVLGGRVFAANREYFDATQRGSANMAFGQGLSALGGAIVSNAGAIQRIGTYFGQRPADSKLNRNI
jgi:hypothetical protein